MRGFKKKQAPGFEFAGSATIEVNTKKAKQYIKDNLKTPVGDVPLWVLISLGIAYLNEAKEEEGGPC